MTIFNVIKKLEMLEQEPYPDACVTVTRDESRLLLREIERLRHLVNEEFD